MARSHAIIGSGIVEHAAAHRLHLHHDITVYEANRYYGGHTATDRCRRGGRHVAIDTGFIVFNDWTYRTSSPCSSGRRRLAVVEHELLALRCGTSGPSSTTAPR